MNKNNTMPPSFMTQTEDTHEMIVKAFSSLSLSSALFIIFHLLGWVLYPPCASSLCFSFPLAILPRGNLCVWSWPNNTVLCERWNDCINWIGKIEFGNGGAKGKKRWTDMVGMVTLTTLFEETSWLFLSARWYPTDAKCYSSARLLSISSASQREKEAVFTIVFGIFRPFRPLEWSYFESL